MKYNKRDFTLVPSRQARIGMPANQQVVYMWLCEHSDDNNQSFPSRKVLAYECGMSVDTLDRALKELVARGMIAKSGRYNANQQSSNLYEVLLTAEGPQNAVTLDSAEGGPQNRDGGGRKIGTQNYTQLTKPINIVTNVTIGSAEPVTYGNPEINDLFNYWQTKTGVGIQAKLKPNRNACSNLLKRHGLEKLTKLIDGVALAQDDRYAPRISDFCDLQAKLTQLLTWGKAARKGQVYVV
jgi:hypothetical protein